MHGERDSVGVNFKLEPQDADDVCVSLWPYTVSVGTISSSREVLGEEPWSCLSRS